MNKRNAIILLILLLAIGFAAVTTTLFINGTILFGTNEEDFDIYFSKAVLDEVDVSGEVISQDGKTITYETKELFVVGDTSVLDYTVRNNSSNYDAKISVNCVLEGNDYVMVDNTLQEAIIEAKSEETGTLTATLIKNSVEKREYTVECTIDAEAIERESIVNDPIVEGESSTYSIYGYLVDENDNPLPNTAVVAYSDPVYAVSDDEGYIYLEGIDSGSHNLYVMEEKTVEELKQFSRDEMKTKSRTNVGITTNTINVVFPNGDKIVDSVIEKTKKLGVELDANGGQLDTTSVEVTKGSRYGELPTATKSGYTFAGWYTEETGGTEIKKDTNVKDSGNHTIYAQWNPITYTIVYNANGGTGTMSSVTHTYGVAKTLTANAFTRSGYAFNGWNTAANGTGTTYANSASVTNLTSTSGGTVTLYAQWKKKTVTVVSGTGKSKGNILAIGNEQFYVISNNGTTIKMLSRYNLYVGGESDGSHWNAYSSYTGRQNSTMKGQLTTTPWRGVTNFSTSSNYSGSLVEGYVNTYSKYLKNTYGVTNTATVLTTSDLSTLGCSTTNNTCTGAPSWVYSTSYWGPYGNKNAVWGVFTDGRLLLMSYTYSIGLGVRPVISISASLL